MADNVSFTPGSGGTAAADEIGGVMYARVKIGLGADGSATDAVGGAGASSAGTMRVIHATDDPALAAVQVQNAAISTGQAGTPALAVRRDAKTAPADADGKAGLVALNDVGDVRVDGGQNFVVRATPTVTAGGYTANDLMGSTMTLTSAARISGGGGLLTGITAAIKDTSAATWAASDVEVMIFSSAPAGTYTDNAVINSTSLSNADALKLLGSVVLDVKAALGNISLLKATNVNIPFVCSGSANLYAQAVNRGGKSPSATDALQFTFHMVRD